MKLLGGYGSPFTRRVAITMRLYGLPYEHDPDVRGNGVIETFNPLGRIPALVLDNGTTLIDSAAILDYLDHSVGPERSLTPLSGEERAQAVSLLALAVGSAEKGAAMLYEIERRPKEKWHAPYLEQLGLQVKRGFEFLDAQFKGPWMAGDKLSQLDVTCVSFWNVLRVILHSLGHQMSVSNIDALIEKTASIEAFSATALSEVTLDAARTRGLPMDELTDFSVLK